MRAVAAFMFLLASQIPTSPGLAAGCTTGQQPSTAGFPLTQGKLVFQAGDALYLTAFAGKNATTAPIVFGVSSGSPPRLTEPRNANFSPDGQWIVFSAIDNSVDPTVRNVFLARASGGNLVNVTKSLDQTQAYEDARITADGKSVYFKMRYRVATADSCGDDSRATFFIVGITLPTTGDPTLTTGFSTLLTENDTEISAPFITPDGQSLYFWKSKNQCAGIYVKSLPSGKTAAFSVTKGRERYYPAVRDASAVFFAGWTKSYSGTGDFPNDQLFMKSTASGATAKLLPVNACDAENADPAPVGGNYVIFSSDRLTSHMDLFVGEVSPAKPSGRAKFWKLPVNAPSTASFLGTSYTSQP